jgi:hypothetical protein
MSTPSFNTYLNSFQKKKGELKGDHTNTRIGDNEIGIYGGTYMIPDLDYGGFLSRYAKEILETGGVEYLTETQLASDGPITIDLDFRFAYGTPERWYTQDHIDDLINACIDDISRMFQLNESSYYQIFVMEKTNIL